MDAWNASEQFVVLESKRLRFDYVFAEYVVQHFVRAGRLNVQVQNYSN